MLIFTNPCFKAHVSPHEMLQSVVLVSEKTFQITQQGDAVDFIKWLLNKLHLALNGTKKRSSSIIYKTFCGGMRIHSKKILPTEVTDEDKKAPSTNGWSGQLPNHTAVSTMN